MSLNVNNLPKGNSKFKVDPLEIGTYPARVVRVVDLGLQPQVYAGEVKEPKPEVFVGYELTDEFMKDEAGNDLEDKPRWVSETFPLNRLDNDKAKSTQRYHAYDPSGDLNGDFSQIVGLPCNITIAHQVGKGKNAGRIFEKVANVTSVRPKDAAKMPELKNTPQVFLMDDPDVEVFNGLPDFLKDKIKSGLEYEGSTLQKLLGGSQKPSQGKGATTPQGRVEKPVQRLTEAEYDEEGMAEQGRDLVGDDAW